MGKIHLNRWAGLSAESVLEKKMLISANKKEDVWVQENQEAPRSRISFPHFFTIHYYLLLPQNLNTELSEE